MKSISVEGKKYKVTASDRQGKKFKISTSKGAVHFGAKGYKISPGTAKGNRYCARSSGIKSGKGVTPNKASRGMWRCKGKRSTR